MKVRVNRKTLYFLLVLCLLSFIGNNIYAGDDSSMIGFIKYLNINKDYPLPVVRQADDSGYLVLGSVDYPKPKEDVDFLLIKFDSSGNLLWEKKFGGKKTDLAMNFIISTDGNIMVVGGTSSFDDKGIFLMKVNKDGKELWQKIFPTKTAANAIQEVPGTGFILSSNFYDLENRTFDIHIIGTDYDGNELWQKKFGEKGYSEDCEFLRRTTDGDFLILGPAIKSGNYDTLLIKIDKTGKVIWNKRYGSPTEGEKPVSIAESDDGDYIFLTNISDSIKLFKIDKSGNVISEKSYPKIEGAALEKTSDGNFIISGSTDSKLLLMKIDKDLNLTWKKVFDEYKAVGLSVKQTRDGGFILTGITDKVFLLKVNVK